MYFPLLVFFSFCLHFITIQHLFDMKWEGQIYSMLISPVHAQWKSSLHSDDLKSSSHTDWSNFPLHFLLPLHASCKCDNVLCSEIHTISVHLPPNVSKKKKKRRKACVLFWMNCRDGGEWLIARVDLGKRTPMEGSCLTACHQLFKA